MNKIRLLLLTLLVQVSMGVGAQIPAEVKEVLRKCSEKMDNPAGVEVDVKLHVGMKIISMNGTVKSFSKGDKSLEQMTVKGMGVEEYSETGFDGEQEWEYKKAMKKGDADSLIISKTTKKKKGDNDLDFDMDKEYRKAKMKLKGANYEITFTDPIDKDAPSKSIMKINKDNFYFYEMTVKSGLMTMRLTVNKIKVGVPDSQFIFDESKYKGAVVVRKNKN